MGGVSREALEIPTSPETALRAGFSDVGGRVRMIRPALQWQQLLQPGVDLVEPLFEIFHRRGVGNSHVVG